MRYASAIAEGLTEKALYYETRLEMMNEPLEVVKIASRDHEVSNIDRLVAVSDLLQAVGVDTSKLSNDLLMNMDREIMQVIDSNLIK